MSQHRELYQLMEILTLRFDSDLTVSAKDITKKLKFILKNRKQFNISTFRAVAIQDKLMQQFIKLLKFQRILKWELRLSMLLILWEFEMKIQFIIQTIKLWSLSFQDRLKVRNNKRLSNVNWLWEVANYLTTNYKSPLILKL